MNDVIDRQAAIDALEEQLDYLQMLNKAENPTAESEWYGINWARNTIADLPSAQQWIPCSERLPDDLAEVNVTWTNHRPDPYYNFIKDVPFTASAVHYKDKWFWYSATCADILAEYGKNEIDEIDGDIEILAWMPLPDPWKGGEE